MSTPNTQNDQLQEALKGASSPEAMVRLDSAVITAGMRAELFTLFRQPLAIFNGGAPINFHNLTHREIMGNARGQGLIGRLIDHIYPANDPMNRVIYDTAVRNFRSNANAYAHQGVPDSDRVQNEAMFTKALMDAMMEHIKANQIEALAAQVAANLPNAAPPNAVDDLRNHYRRAGTPPTLTQHGFSLLERFRKGGANPMKALMAFAAALDTQVFDPQAGIALNPTVNGLNRLNLRTDVLGASEEAIDATANRYLQAIARDLQNYEEESKSRENLLYVAPVLRFPPTPPHTAAELNAYNTQLAKYNNTLSLVQSIRNSVNNLRTHLGANVPANWGLAPLAARLSSPVVLRASAVRNAINHGIAGTLLTAEEYEANSRQTETGLEGTDAINRVLREYIKRVGNVDEKTANEALALTTSRAVSSRQDLRLQRQEITEVQPDFNHREEMSEFIKKNNDAKRFWDRKTLRFLPLPVARSNAFDLFWSGLQKTLRLEDGGGFSEVNSMDRLVERYSTLWYLTKILPSSDEKHLPLTPDIAQRMTNLRRAIVKRQLDNIHLFLNKKGIDQLTAEQAAAMGLAGAHIENLPFDEMQDKLIEDLEPAALDGSMQTKVNRNIERAWQPVAVRKSKTQARREFRKRVFGGTLNATKKTLKWGTAPIWGIPYLAYKGTTKAGKSTGSWLKKKLFTEEKSFFG